MVKCLKWATLIILAYCIKPNLILCWEMNVQTCKPDFPFVSFASFFYNYLVQLCNLILLKKMDVKHWISILTKTKWHALFSFSVIQIARKIISEKYCNYCKNIVLWVHLDFILSSSCFSTIVSFFTFHVNTRKITLHLKVKHKFAHDQMYAIFYTWIGKWLFDILP